MGVENKLDIFSFEEGDDVMAYIRHKLDDGSPSFPFSDSESYRFLFDSDMLIPGLTLLRIDDGSVGGHYRVTSQRNYVEGVRGEAHSGREGIHHIDNLVSDCPYWEPGSLYLPGFGFECKMLDQIELIGSLEVLNLVCLGDSGNDETENYFKRVSQKK